MPGSSGPGAIRSPNPTRRDVVVWSGSVAALVLVYGAVLPTWHRWIGNPAFLVGLALCLLAAALLGVRGALITIVAIVLIDRSFAPSMPLTAETGETAAVISTLVKLVFAGGLGWIVDSRRRVRALNAELRREVTARE